MIIFIIRIINYIIQMITLLVIVKVFLSYFMSPYRPLRSTLDRIVEPMLRPIRRLIPTVGMIDLSPIVLIIVIQIVGRIVISLLSSIG